MNMSESGHESKSETAPGLRTADGERFFDANAQSAQNGDHTSQSALENEPHDKYNSPDSTGSSDTEAAEPAQKTEHSVFAPHLKPLRTGVAMHLIKMLVFISAYSLCVFSLYWGAAYNRSSRFKNLRMLVVVADEQAGDVRPVIGESVRQLVQLPQVQQLGDWHVYLGTEFQRQADKHGNTLEEEVTRQVHHQEFWLSLYVRPGASSDFYEALKGANTSYNVLGSISVIYETGRDINAMLQYVTPNMKRVEERFLAQVGGHIAPQLAQNLTQSQQRALFENQNTTALLATQFPFLFLDKRPFTDAVLIAPTQVGLIYLIILTFVQLNFFMPINFMMGSMNLTNLHYIGLKLTVSYVGYFIISLMYSFVSLAMQVDFTQAFGKSGFLVYWMSSFLTMCAVGGMNEVMFLVCFATIPPFVGAWLLFWVISNVTPTFSPLALCAHFYRYGYAMPIHSSYEISKVVFFNTYKGTLGRDYAILVIWNVLVVVLIPFAAVFYKRRTAKKAAAERQKVVDLLK